MLKKANPNIIVITGDMIDSRNTRVEIAMDFARKATKIAPCYYVTGNHESRVPSELEVLLSGLESAGVKILRNEKTNLEVKGESIILLGADDPMFLRRENNTNNADIMRNILSVVAPKEDKQYTILLSHRPELFQVYTEHSIDLTLSGHAHGGQIRLPFVGGLFAPVQGFLPTYYSGLYTQDACNMIVSCGVGNSLFPLRIFNPPEVVLVELNK